MNDQENNSSDKVEGTEVKNAAKTATRELAKASDTKTQTPTPAAVVSNSETSTTEVITKELPPVETQTETAPVFEQELQPHDKVLNQIAEEEVARQAQTEATGGVEYVGSGIHKGRQIIDGNIDYSTPSDREKAIAAANTVEVEPVEVVEEKQAA